MAKRGYESQKTGQKVDDLLDKIDNLNVPEWALQESKPSYTAQEVHALPENTSIPKKTSDLVNDRGFITQESDPTVPLWAKQPSKPTYTAEEVGALSEDTPIFSGDYNDLRNKPTIPTVPENVSAFNNDAGYLTQHQDISGKEDKSNKVTSLSAQSTDTQYPSAKVVYDELESKQDTINDLASIRSGASAGATAYQLPQSGVPESDLSQGVKDKLNEKEVFWATYGQTTAAEIDAAVAAGKEVMLRLSSYTYLLTTNGDNSYIFTSLINGNNTTTKSIKKSDSTWSSNSVMLEVASNRVSSWRPSPDITHYPSEKLVKDSLDTKADIGDILFANFSRLTPKKTFEYDVSDTAYHPLFSRANTGISQLMSEVDDIVKFRITVTGTNIYARVDVLVRFQPSLVSPCVMAWNDNYGSTAGTTGIYQFRMVIPKVLNSGYDWFVDYNTYNNNARHIKVEIYEDTENITWLETKIDSSYNATYHNNSGLQIYINRGLCANNTWRLEHTYANTSAAAYYISNYLSTWIGSSSIAAGEVLGNSQLAIVSEQKVYKATNKNVPIDCDCGVFILGGAYSTDNVITNYAHVRQKVYWTTLTADPALTFDTFARGDQVYLRCTLGQDGKIYPDGHLSNVKSAGYTWVHIGTAASATAINLDTCGKPFITLNNDGKVTHINGTAVMDSSMSKWGVVSQTQTWTQASDGGYDYTMSDLQYGWIPQANIDLYEAAGAVFNEQSGYFELNGLEDISYEEMKVIYAQSQSTPFNSYSIGGWTPYSYDYRRLLTARTTTNNMLSKDYCLPSFGWNQCVETIGFFKHGFPKVSRTARLYGGVITFYGCNRLKTIYDVVDWNNASGTNVFYGCTSLETLNLTNIKTNVSLSASARLSVASVLYMIQNEASTSAITITLHPTAYARAIADSDVQTALQAHTNVSLASA